MKAKYITLPKLSPYIDFKKYKIFKENPDALCESNMCNRKVLEKEIIEYTNREKIL